MGLFDDLQGTQGGAASANRGGVSDRVKPSGDASDIPNKARAGKKTAKKPRTASKRPAAAKSPVGSKKSVMLRSDAASSTDVVTTDGIDATMLPQSLDDVPRLLPSWVSTWCEAHGVQDMRKASPLVFGALCMDIGAVYIRPAKILRDTAAHGKTPTGGASTCGAYNPAAVLSIYDTYERLCAEYDKIPFADVFASFCGVSLSYVKQWGDTLTSAGLCLAKNTHAREMQAIRRAASRDPVGRLAILNNEYWGGGAGVPDSGAQTVASLPSEHTFALIEQAPLD